MRKRILIPLVLAVLFTGCTSTSAVSQTGGSTAAEVQAKADYSDDTWDDSSSVHITLNGDDAETDGNGVSIDGGTITITKAGTYVLSGEYTGTLMVNSSSKTAVHLVLNGVSITSADGPAVNIQSGDTVITLAEGTSNILTDSSSYSDQSDEAPSAAVYAKDDLAFNGSGSLSVYANYNDGITSRDNLYIYNGTITIQAEDDGIVARDAFYTGGGSLKITATGDGIKTTNEDTDKGNAEINGGTISITAGDDGIETVHDLLINTGAVEIETTGSASSDDNKAKGLSVGGNLTISGGLLNMDTADDAVHAAGDITISDGTMNISGGDDGIHTDSILTINGGTITIARSYEGLEAEHLVINDGTVSIVSSDDGINTADPSFTGNMMQADSSVLEINGGTITVDAGGDGIDMNGSGTMNGGTVIVYGPERDMDGALDYAGTFTVNGGTLLAGGSSGMPQFPDENSSTYTIVIGTSGGSISIQDDAGAEIAAYTSSKSWSLLSYSSDQLEKGSTYTIYEDGTSIGSVTIEDKITYLNYSSNNRGFGPGGGQRGQGV